MRNYGWRTALVTAVVVGAFLLIGGWGYRQYQARQRLESYLATRYQQAFYDLIEHVENVQVMLGKGVVAGTPAQHVATLTDVWRVSYAAQSDLAKLPVAQPVLMRVSKFLTQVGDYSFALAKGSAAGRPLNDENWRKLLTLRDEAARLSTELHALADRAGDGRLWWPEIRRGMTVGMRETSSPLSERFGKIDREMEEVPTIIYDGPFSDHLEKKQARGLTGAMVTQVQARDVALRFLPEPYQGEYRVATVTESRGRIPAYHFALDPPQGRRGPRIEMDVSKKGGHVVWMLNNRVVARTSLTTAEAAARAQAFLKARGYPEMVPTYAIQGENLAVIPFAYSQEGVIIYPDMVKVTVALDNGEILGFEASNYLMSHHPRTLPKPKLSREEAQERLNPNLQVLSSNLAVIPRDNPDQEVLAYEFRGNLAGEEYIVYINALTGEEERILRVVHTAEGTTII